MSFKLFYQTGSLTFKYWVFLSANGGALLYIKDTINYKLRPDLNVDQLESINSIRIN